MFLRVSNRITHRLGSYSSLQSFSTSLTGAFNISQRTDSVRKFARMQDTVTDVASQVVVQMPPVYGDTLFRRINFLGTSSAVPCPGRCNVSSLVITLSTGSTIMVDCGEATQHQMMRSRTAKMAKVDVILITHLHGDHFFGIFGMLATLGTNGRTQPVTVVGPKGIRNAIDTVFMASESPDEEPTTPITVIELDTDAPTALGLPGCGGDPLHALAMDLGVDIMAVPIEHRVPCLGYVISERLRPGPLDAKKAQALGARGTQMGSLKAGKDVVLDDGRVVSASEVTAAPTAGRRMCVIQDTHDPTRFQEHFRGCDVMVHEATYDHSLHDKAIANGHSTARMAAQFAVDMGARNLILTHFSSRYDKELLARERSECSSCSPVSEGQRNRVVFTPPKCWTLAQTEPAEPAACVSGKPRKMSVYDLRDEAQDTVAAAVAGGSAPVRVHIASDFRTFEADRAGAWQALEEADVDLSKMF